MILFSIVIPSYNSNNLLTKCINSFGNFLQHSEVEFIIIDDCSEYNQMSFLRDLKINNFKFIRNKKNLGLSRSRNIGIKKSKGKYVIFVDSDDEILENEFAAFFKYVKENNINVDLIRVGLIENTIKKSVNKNKLYFDLSSYIMECFFFQKYTTVMSQTHVYKREFLMNNMFYKKRIYSEDLLHLYVSYDNLTTILVTNYVYYVYKHNTGSITNSKKEEMIKDQKLIYEIAFRDIKSKILLMLAIIFYKVCYRHRYKGKKIKTKRFFFFKNYFIFFFIFSKYFIINIKNKS